MKKICNLIFVLMLIFGYRAYPLNSMKEAELINIMLFNDFKFSDLKDEFLKKSGVDANYVTIFNDKQEEITESNYKQLVVNFANHLVYEYKDIFGKKLTKNRTVYLFEKDEFIRSISIIGEKYKIKNVSVDIVYDDTSANKILVGKIITEPKLPQNKDSYILKIDRNNKIAWGKIFEDSKINKFNKIINVSDNQYCLIASGYRKSEWTDGFIARFDGNGNFLWEEFYGSSHIDDFKDIVALENGDILVLAEVSNGDGDVEVPITINNPLNKDLVLLKYDSNGNIIWQNSIVNKNELTALKIINEDENVIVVGEVLEDVDEDYSRNILISSFDLNGKMKFSTIIKDYEDKNLNDSIS